MVLLTFNTRLPLAHTSVRGVIQRALVGQALQQLRHQQRPLRCCLSLPFCHVTQTGALSGSASRVPHTQLCHKWRGHVTQTRVLSGSASRVPDTHMYPTGNAFDQKLQQKNGFLPYTLNVSAWFCIPEQGMAGEELLSRGSAFIVPREGDSDGEENGLVHIITSAHVVHPFSYPKYYPDDWLKHVKEKHVTCKLEARNAKGRVVFETELKSKVWRHAERDVAVLHSPNDEFLLSELDAFGRKALTFAKDMGDEGCVYHFMGHQKDEKDPEQGHIPDYVRGALAGRVREYTFCSTERVLKMGMCGGPVLNPRGECVGLTEAIVSTEGPLKDHASVISVKDISAFLRDVEAGLLACRDGDE